MGARRLIHVLVPYRPDGGPRDRVWSWVAQWWTERYPRWPVTVGVERDPSGPWRKAVALHDALTAADPADDDVCVVADADVICPDLEVALAGLRSHRWVMPHRTVCRLTEPVTALVLDGRPPPAPPRPGMTPSDHVFERVHPGACGGGLTILPAGLLRQVPLDPRFAGWGQEDHAWGRALTMVGGHPWRGRGHLWHLWHPPQPRMDVPRGIGSPESEALERRYRTRPTVPAMLELLGEATALLDEPGPLAGQ